MSQTRAVQKCRVNLGTLWCKEADFKREMKSAPGPKCNLLGGMRENSGEFGTHRLFSHVVDTVRTAMVVTCEKLSCKCEVEIGLCFGNEIGISLDEGGGFMIRQAMGTGSSDEGD